MLTIIEFIKENSSKKNRYEKLVNTVFTRENLLFKVLDDLFGYPSMKEYFCHLLKIIEEEPTYTREIYLYSKLGYFTLQMDSRNYWRLLLDTHTLLERCKELVYTDDTCSKDFLLNELAESVYLLKQIDRHLIRRIPLQHKKNVASITLLNELLTNALNNYYVAGADFVKVQEHSI